MRTSSPYKQHGAAEKYHAHRAQYCAGLIGTPNEKKACIEQSENPSDYLNWWYALVAWPQGIETWGIIVTGFFVAWQALETRKAAQATRGSVGIARRQMKMYQAKERAQIEVKPGSLSLSEPFIWGLCGNVFIRNLGPTRAYLRSFRIELVWYKKTAEMPVSDPSSNAYLDEQFFDPTGDKDEPISVKAHYFDSGEVGLDWFALAVHEGNVIVKLRGICEYETVGVVYLRYFVYQWEPRVYDIYGLYDKTAAITNNERISRGYWSTKMYEEVEATEDGDQS